MSTDYLIDIGATNVAVGPLRRSKPEFFVSTPSTARDVLVLLDGWLRGFGRARNVVVAVPGLVTPGGSVEAALYSPIKSLDLRAHLERRTTATVHVLNDAKLQAMAYLAASPMHLHITIGTAVGGAIVADGKVLQGKSGFAGEIGHVPVPSSQMRCPCGRLYCLDTVASGWSIARDCGAGWWETTRPEAAVRTRQAGAAVGEAIAAATTLLDLSTYSIAGRLSSNSDFAGGVRGSLAEAAIVALASADTSWKAARSGALCLLES